MLKSINEQSFTQAGQMQNPCQTGDAGLALKTLSDWIKEKS